ncbi:hypothetical protein PGT21_035865 [Puccinia graminis f. sp. tritici]|uniref:Uncharacterized protein n=1 Tax=Puccinia graminis f. sp. tritici TaxID=56615 RepID=A0A5B0N7Y4_PUCGR|nr:hypothetical protein PGT21_035865 [Puccinia graminis f. sp. tritici]
MSDHAGIRQRIDGGAKRDRQVGLTLTLALQVGLTPTASAMGLTSMPNGRREVNLTALAAVDFELD